MKIIMVPGGIVHFSPVDIKCPFCDKHYDDEKYLDRCNMNKSGITRIKCSCGNSFKATYDIQGDWHSWKKEDE